MDRAFSWQSYMLTHTGKVRDHNEDAVFAANERGLWVVADGMGGHDAGDVASTMIVETIEKLPAASGLANYIDQIEDCLLDINSELLSFAQAQGLSTIGSTVAILLFYGEYYCYLWAGDSRIYLFRDNVLYQVSVDHSPMERYVVRGLISRTQASAHPGSNAITRAVGVEKDLYLDLEIQKLRKGDRYLLCSDGLNKHLSNDNIQKILRNNHNTTIACEKLLQTTLMRGAEDNTSVVIVDVLS